LRILHIVPTYFPAIRYGGPILAIHELCKIQVSLGHEVSVYTTNVDGDLNLDLPTGQSIDLDGVKVTYFPVHKYGRRIYFSSAMKIALEKKLLNVDFMHLHSVFLWPTNMAARLAKKHGIPWCVAPRGALSLAMIRSKSYLIKRVALFLFDNWTLQNASFLHATSLMEKKEISGLIPGLSKIEVIPNGVQIPLEHSNKLLLKPYVLYLGRISWKKRIDYLIQAMQYIPDHDLVIAGNDEENLLPKLQKLVLDLSLGNRVHFIGSVVGEKKDALLQSAKILALASLNENFGNVVLESLASSRPVALTKGVALLEEVLLANAGIKLSDNPKEMGMQLNSYLNSQDNLNKMGRNGFNLVKNKFQWASVAKLTIEAYVMNANRLSKQQKVNR